MAGRYGIAQGTLRKGLNEMTLTELSGQIDSYRGTAMAKSTIVRDLTFSYHQRWSLACATAVLALFAVGVLARRPSARWTVGLAAVGACFAYYMLLFLGRSAALGGTIPAFAGAWFPNVIFVLLSTLLLKMISERPEDPVPTR
jgi:lipopolysaccharide export system permease protein